MDLICPYCEKELDINHDDGFGYEEEVKHEIQCPHCQKKFVFETSVSFYFESEKADCLNDGKHDYKITHTHPQEFSEMKCSICGLRRELTNKERSHFKLSTKEEYFDRLDKLRTNN